MGYKFNSTTNSIRFMLVAFFFFPIYLMLKKFYRYSSLSIKKYIIFIAFMWLRVILKGFVRVALLVECVFLKVVFFPFWSLLCEFGCFLLSFF